MSTSNLEDVDIEDEATESFEDKFEIKELFGREYQLYSIEKQINMEPVDEEEESRLRGQHEILKQLFANRRDPLIPESIMNFENILDCGCGTGDWAIEVAESYPDCKVIGLDISPILVEQSERPDNFEPQVADLNIASQSFTFPSNTFDFVNSRFLAGGIAQTRWPSYVTDIRRVLRAGGAVEFIEWDLYFRSDKGNGDRLSALRQWSVTYLNAISSGEGNGRKTRTSPPDLESMLRASGFTNVSARLIDVPISSWGLTMEERELGDQNQKNIEIMLTSVAIFAVVSRNIMSEAAFRDLVTRCTEEMSDVSSEIYLRLYMYVCYGEKA